MNKTRSVILLIILLQTVSIQVPPTLAIEEPEGTLVGGKIRSNTVWTKENSPYILEDNVQVPHGVKLKIEEGVVVDFHIWSMTIEGSLRASGTPEERILFNISDTTLTGYSKARIHFTDESIPWKEGSIKGCLLEYVDIRPANYTVEYGLIKGGTLKLDHVAIYGSRYHINDYYTVETDGLVTNCLFNNVIRAVYMEEGDIRNNKFINIKKGEAIKILNGTARDNYIDNTQVGIKVKNALIYNNTILNTKIRGVSINNNELPYEGCKLRPRVVGNVIRSCKQDAIFISGEIRPLIRRNIIIDNQNGIYFGEYAFHNGTTPRIEYNVFYNNDKNIYIGREDPRIELNLENNWWGTNDTILIEEKIYHEYDEPHICYTDYEPFLTTLPLALPEIKYEYIASVDPAEIELRHKITVSGKVIPPLEKFDVHLTCTGPDQSVFSELLMTNEDGSFSYKFNPDSLGIWNIVLIPKENQLFIDPEPKSLEFTVKKRSSSIDDCAVSSNMILENDEITIIGVLKPRLYNEWIMVSVTNPNGVTYHDQVRTDEEGRFKQVFTGKVPGNYSVDFSWQGNAEVEDASENVGFKVHESSLLKILVKDLKGSPVQGASIRSIFQPKGQGSLSSRTDSNGTVVFSEILSGDYDFIVEKKNYESDTVSSIVVEGETSMVELSLETFGSAASAGIQTGGEPAHHEAPLVYGFIPSVLIFVILIILYSVLHNGKGG